MNTVLFVEDDALIRHHLGAALTAAGYVVLTAATATEAQQIAARQTVDLLLLDIGLPGVSGVLLARRLRESRCRAPLVFLTAYEDAALIAAAIDCGAHAYLVKPIGARQLLPVIETALAASAARAAQETKLIAALHNSRAVSTAVGMLAERHGWSVEQAFETLRQQARRREMKVEYLAGEFVAGRLVLI